MNSLLEKGLIEEFEGKELLTKLGYKAIKEILKNPKDRKMFINMIKEEYSRINPNFREIFKFNLVERLRKVQNA